MDGVTRAWLACVLCGLCACGGAGVGNPLAPYEARESSRYAGDPAGPPRMEGLPECDVEREELSADMRRAWLLSEEALAIKPPASPTASSAQSLQVWSDTVLRSWLADKTERAMAAREELNVAAGHGERERIISGALLGLVYEDVARVLVELPVPNELLSEPDIVDIYHEVMLSHAEPFLAHARAAYEACAANGKHSRDLKHWGRYCGHRREVLPGETIEAVDGTVVTVERD